MQNQSEDTKIKVNRKSIDSLDVFEITEDELRLLEVGSPSSTILNFGIAAFSTGVSFFASLLTLTTTDDRVYLTLLTFCAVGIFGGLVLFVVWYRLQKGSQNIVSRIRDRTRRE